MNNNQEKNIFEKPNNINLERKFNQKNIINKTKFRIENINTPKDEDDYIITPDNPIKADIQPKNIYQEKEANLANINIQKNQNNNIKEDPKMEVYKITPGKSVREEIGENPYVKKESETPSGDYIIPKLNSICLDFKSNPYKEKIIIPQESSNYHLKKNNNKPIQNKLNNHNHGNNDKINMITKNRINSARKPKYINTNNINDINDGNKKPLEKQNNKYLYDYIQYI